MPCYDTLPDLKEETIEYYQEQLETGAAQMKVNTATGTLEIYDPQGDASKNGMNDSCVIAGLTITPDLSAQLAAQGINAQDVTAAQAAHDHAH